MKKLILLLCILSLLLCLSSCYNSSYNSYYDSSMDIEEYKELLEGTEKELTAEINRLNKAEADRSALASELNTIQVLQVVFFAACVILAGVSIYFGVKLYDLKKAIKNRLELKEKMQGTISGLEKEYAVLKSELQKYRTGCANCEEAPEQFTETEDEK